MSRHKREQQLQEELELLRQKIDLIQDRINTADTNDKRELTAHYNRLLEMHRDASKKLENLRSAEEHHWDKLQGEAQDYWKALGNELKAFDSRI